MKPKIVELDVCDLRAPLECGTALIEASAGAGKTYALAALFLRLLLENGLEVREILVSTFTVAATAELRDRIRRLLSAADEAFVKGSSDDPFLAAVTARFASETALMRDRLAEALRSFDEASIHTIHGFCERMLRDRAFESGMAFDQELVTDETAMIQEVAEDFWRIQTYGCDVCLDAAAAAGKLGPSNFASLLRERLNHPLATILPNRMDGEIEKIRNALPEALERLRDLWRSESEKIRVLFLEQNDWSKSPYNKQDVVRGHLENARSCLEDLANLPGFESLLIFSKDEILGKVKKGASAPEHEFFDLCAEVTALCRRYALALQLEFLAWAPAELDRRKLRRNVASFSDLLTRLHRGLAGASGDALAGAIRTRFKAALIDEFQDTDPLQDGIFRRIFGSGQSWLFLIGDPKQAIYGFRSADVFTYLGAIDRADRRFTLGTNFRSSTALVEATNRIFSRPLPDRSFILDRIGFHPVKSCGKNEAKLFSGDGLRAPLRIWAFPGDGKEKKSECVSNVVASVAAGIARLLHGGGALGQRPVVPGDIAVLTGENRQALDVLHALQELGVPGVVLSNGNVFASLEARELLRILRAAASPRIETFVRAALLTDLIGSSVRRVHALSEDESAWETELVRFQSWHELWVGKGFIQMFRQILLDLKVRERLLARRDGERQLTNLLHLSELLQQVATQEDHSPGALQQWLAGRISESAKTTLEEHEMRLERDDAAVRISTIHRSKGLEYEIVFCPFLWSRNGSAAKGPVRFHDPDRADALILDFGSEEMDRHRELAMEEQFAEHARLVYVALTRARQRCDVMWGQFKSAPDSAAAWFLHAPTLPPGRIAGALKSFLKDRSESQWSADLDALAAGSNGSIQIVEPADAADPPRYAQAEINVSEEPRSFLGTIERDWGVSSFSSLADQYDAEIPDHDPRASEPVEFDEREPEGIHAFPAGARTGVCLHEILQELDFSDRIDLPRLVNRKLQAFSFDSKLWGRAVSECLDRVISTKLTPGFTLEEIVPSRRLVELEFYLPVGRLNAESLRKILDVEAGRLDFSPRRGWLKGFIDLVFERDGRYYIADWKSNRLGSHAGAYTGAALNAAMTAHHYSLQYHLYTVALHRYLRWRVPGYDYDLHFGGVFYVFLRGVDPARPELGIVDRRPPRETIERLDQWLR